MPAIQTPSGTGQSATGAAQTGMTQIPAKPAGSAIQVVTQYNFYENAARAKWKNPSVELPFSGADNDNRGFVRKLHTGTICPNNKANNLLQTHPQWVNSGWIEGRYPVMRLGQNVKFKAVGALLKGAEGSDGVVMSVLLQDGAKTTRLIRKRINCDAYTPMEVDLSPWAGKTVQIILNVSAGQTSVQDWAVWVNPRLDDK
jgi:hypothetical protein